MGFGTALSLPQLAVPEGQVVRFGGFAEHLP